MRSIEKKLEYDRQYHRTHPCRVPTREENAQRCRNWRHTHPEQKYKWTTLFKHHLSQQGFDDLLVKQGGLCPVCKEPLIITFGSLRSGKTVHIDHDHTCCPGAYSCGKCIRGLLHCNCNAGIGYLRDDSTICRNAAEYLSSFKRS